MGELMTYTLPDQLIYEVVIAALIAGLLLGSIFVQSIRALAVTIVELVVTNAYFRTRKKLKPNHRDQHK